jgi:hypothetical protein
MVKCFGHMVREASGDSVFCQQPLKGGVVLDIETYYSDARVTKEGKRMKVGVDTVCDRYKSKIRLLQLYRDGSGLVWLIDIRALERSKSIGPASFQEIRDILAEREIVGYNDVFP